VPQFNAVKKQFVATRKVHLSASRDPALDHGQPNVKHWFNFQKVRLHVGNEKRRLKK
jgi:hypothetical protein